MKLPAIRGLMDRRILVNFKVDPAVLAQIVPAPLRPIEIGGHGIAGICLIRLRHLRPSPLPAWLGLGSENAAHRIAVEWDEAGCTRAGVYIPRRDTSSRISALVAGRLFAGLHHHARFDVQEHHGDYRVTINSDDRAVHIAVRGHEASSLPADSVFGSLDEAASFFERGSLGFSPTTQPGQLEGVELCNRNRNVTPLEVDHVESNYFDDTDLFPAGTITLDSALLMRGIDHDWKIGRTMCCNAHEARCEANAR
ncbi:MAG: DUF2071 domain-containing protein [Planctomycetes bacterium]|nr:DUF2071 domain-containing protein [Planctomycetota bacterium]